MVFLHLLLVYAPNQRSVFMMGYKMKIYDSFTRTTIIIVFLKIERVDIEISTYPKSSYPLEMYFLNSSPDCKIIIFLLHII